MSQRSLCYGLARRMGDARAVRRRRDAVNNGVERRISRKNRRAEFKRIFQTVVPARLKSRGKPT